MLPDSRHFKASEFACHDGTPYPEEWDDRYAELTALCDAIRDAWGAPLAVVSGYRTEAHNDELRALDADRGSHGVASGSQHVQGRAADLRPAGAASHDAAQLYRIVLSLQQDGKLPQLGGVALYPASNWVHVDTYHAPDGHLRKWFGT